MLPIVWEDICVPESVLDQAAAHTSPHPESPSQSPPLRLPSSQVPGMGCLTELVVQLDLCSGQCFCSSRETAYPSKHSALGSARLLSSPLPRRLQR